MLDRRRFLSSAALAAIGATVPLRGSDARWLRATALSNAPRAVRPVPTAAQLRWQREELALFLHLGVNTFTDREWGDGTETPALFDPGALDARSWARTARSAGFKSLVLTAKHHDGFCLWPTATTAHSVAASPWRGGQGDVVRELADACRAEQLGLGLYLSPWDRHEPRYGDSAAYMDFYVRQLEELCTRYGLLSEVWFDGANGEGPNGRKQVYDWPHMHATVRRLQPHAVMFSDAGPDVRWIGNERGVAGETCWSTIDPDAVPYAGYDVPGVGEVLQRGHADGAVWRPGETDVSIRPGWFHHAAEDAKVRTGAELLALYESSVGRNSKLLLNVPPDRAGQLGATDVASLSAFGRMKRDLFARDLAQGAVLSASPSEHARDAYAVLDPDPGRAWTLPTGSTEGVLTLALKQRGAVRVVRIEEQIEHGQTIESFTVEAIDGVTVTELARGTTIGYCRLLRIAPTRAEQLRVTVRSTLGRIRLARISLHEGAG